MQSKKNMINDHACSPSSIVMKFVNFQIPWSTSTHETHISITLLRRRKHDDENTHNLNIDCSMKTKKK